MFWLTKVKSVPDQLLLSAQNPVEDARTLQVFQSQSSSLYAIGRGWELLLVLGVLPPSLLSNTGYLWMARVSDLNFSVPELRVLKKAFQILAKNEAKYLFAELPKDDAIGIRFVEFFGFEATGEYPDRILYERTS